MCQRRKPRPSNCPNRPDRSHPNHIPNCSPPQPSALPPPPLQTSPPMASYVKNVATSQTDHGRLRLGWLGQLFNTAKRTPHGELARAALKYCKEDSSQ
eukprot:362069-Chlamydomonas_euryale.AAC.5